MEIYIFWNHGNTWGHIGCVPMLSWRLHPTMGSALRISLLVLADPGSQWRTSKVIDLGTDLSCQCDGAMEWGRIGMLRLFNCLSFLFSAALVSVLLRNFLVADPAAYGLKVQAEPRRTKCSVSKSGSWWSRLFHNRNTRAYDQAMFPEAGTGEVTHISPCFHPFLKPVPKDSKRGDQGRNDVISQKHWLRWDLDV